MIRFNPGMMGAVGSEPFIPSSLFGDSEMGGWYDPSDLDTVWQDSSGTTPAVADDPVGRIDDKSGNDNHLTQTTNDDRPFLRQDGSGNYYLEGDGSNKMSVPSSAALFNFMHDGTGGSLFSAARLGTSSNPGSILVLMGNNNSGSTSTGFVFGLDDRGTSSNRNNGAWCLITKSSSGNYVIFDEKSNVFTPNTEAVVGFTYIDQGGDDCFVYKDNTLVKDSAQSNAPSVGDASEDLHLFDDGSGNFELSGRFYGGLLIDRVLTTDERGSLNQWLSNKAGL